MVRMCLGARQQPPTRQPPKPMGFALVLALMMVPAMFAATPAQAQAQVRLLNHEKPSFC